MARGKHLDDEKELDYGKMADQMASDEDSSDAVEAESSEDDQSADEAGTMSDDHGDGSDVDDEQEDDGSDLDADSGDETVSSNGDEEAIMVKTVVRSAIKSTEPCSFDLRNLLAMNSHGVNESKLYASKSTDHDGDRITIPTENQHLLTVNEEYLLEKATDGCAQLLSVLWQLPVERSDAGPLGTLPKFDELPLPRSLPPPPPKQLTKWEKFAKEKGLPLNKTKRSRKVWDEATNSWKYRHGFEKANDDTKEWPIMEVKANHDPFEDPWERARDEKKARRERNQESRMKNMERAGALPKGTTKSVVKQRSSAR